MRPKGIKTNKHICRFLETKPLTMIGRIKGYRNCRHCELAIKTDDDCNRCPCCNRLFYTRLLSRLDKTRPEYEYINNKKYTSIKRDLGLIKPSISLIS